MIAFLDGMPVINPDTTLRHPSFTLRRHDETGDRAFGFTGDIIFEGSDYDYIFAILKTDPNASNNKILLTFENDCCSERQTYEFYITSQSLTWCEGECKLTASAVEKAISDDQFTCLNNTMIWDDYAGFKSMVHPRMSYCNELRPNWLHDVMIILIMATWTSFLTIGPILIVIAAVIVVINFIIGINNSIIGAINTIPGIHINPVNPIDIDGDPSTNAFVEFDNWVNKMLENSFGCGRQHPSPLVREYARNVCTKCGLTFASSIFNNPNSDYYNTVYHNAPINKGVEPQDHSTFWIEENAPLLNGVLFFNQLKDAMNLDYKIKNNILTLEREDYFVPSAPWLDLTTIDPDKLNVCWKWSTKKRYSYGNFYYQRDAVDTVGSESGERWGDIVEWNSNPYSPQQSGEFKPLIPFTTARFRDDGIDRDVLTAYENLPTIGTVLRRYKNAMIMNAHNSFTPKLLIWDGVQNENASVDKFINKNYLVGQIAGVGLNQFYNYPMWINADTPGNLYDRFWAIRNPRSANFQGLDFTAIVDYDCALLSAVDLDGVVRTSEGDSVIIDSIVINDSLKQLTIKGTV